MCVPFNSYVKPKFERIWEEYLWKTKTTIKKKGLIVSLIKLLFYLQKDITNMKIIDDENFSEFINEYLKYEKTTYNPESINDFIEQLDNTALVCALESLSKIEMMVIFLLFEKELSSSEASKILKICSDSVTRIKKRALKKLEKYLKGGK